MLDREGVTKFLSGENIRCRDTAEVSKKICDMKKDGYSALQVRVGVKSGRVQSGLLQMCNRFQARPADMKF